MKNVNNPLTNPQPVFWESMSIQAQLEVIRHYLKEGNLITSIVASRIDATLIEAAEIAKLYFSS